MYSEISPSIELNSYVENFWVFSTNKFTEKFKVCPDACTDLIFDLNLSKVFLSAAMNTYQSIEVPAKSNLIGIRFKSENFGSILGIPLDEFKNQKVELSEILPRFDCRIVNELNNLESLDTKIQNLAIFVKLFGALSFERRDELIISVANRIRQLKGNFVVNDLVTYYHISLRQLQRRFKKYIGLTIKEFSNIVRLKNAEISIRINPEISLMEVAFNTGYYDHSHMNYEFNRIAGENPSNFR